MEALRKALVEMLYDNGAITNGRTEDGEVARVLLRLQSAEGGAYTANQLQAANDDLARLSSDEIFVLCCCEQPSAVKVSPATSELLNDAFKAV